MKDLKLYVELARLNKPVGIFLLLWPTLWALWLAQHGFPQLKLLIIFILGTITTRSAGCVMSDLLDRHFDRQDARTRNRPLAAETLSVKQALIFLALLSLFSLGLLLQLNYLSIMLGVLAALIIFIYPLGKRITYFPQVILGIAFSMGIPLAFAATLNYVPLRCYYLFLVAVIWPIIYDTAYAITDLDDDQKIGVKSTAVFFKDRSRLFIYFLQIIFICGLLFIGIIEKLTWFFYCAVFGSALLFLYQQRLLKQHQPFLAFLNNQWIGFILWLGILFSL